MTAAETEGVVFLKGRVASAELKKWASDLGRNTQYVVAVANRMEATSPSIWDWNPAWQGLMGLWRDLLRSLPLICVGLIILGLSIAAGVLAARTLESPRDLDRLEKRFAQLRDALW